MPMSAISQNSTPVSIFATRIRAWAHNAASSLSHFLYGEDVISYDDKMLYYPLTEYRFTAPPTAPDGAIAVITNIISRLNGDEHFGSPTVIFEELRTYNVQLRAYLHPDASQRQEEACLGTILGIMRDANGAIIAKTAVGEWHLY